MGDALSDASLEALSRLLDEHACARLVLLSARHVDDGPAAALAALFAPDGELVRPNGEVLHGRAAIEAAYAQRPPDRITRHLLHAPLIERVSAHEALGHTAVTLWTGSSDDPPGPRGRVARGGPVIGSFEDRFVKTADGWCIAHRRASFVLQAPA
jgi:SnoaL-like domain